MRQITTILLISLLFLEQASACDLCSVYNSVESQKAEAGKINVGLAEQFTGFDRLQNNGHFTPNEMHQHLESSITQVFGAYDLTDRIGVQINIPYINRRFKRVEGELVEQGSEAGLGDITLQAKYIPYRLKDADSTLSIQLFAGVKLPTGDSDRLKEELAEHDHGPELVDVALDQASPVEHEHMQLKHADHGHEVPSAVHGHDLALGSGSVDFPVGVNILAQSGRILLLGQTQYVFRTEGDHSYTYADDFTWDVGPGYYLALGHDFTISAVANLSGERKGKDRGLGGESQGDTGTRAVYLGPQLLFTSCESLSGELGLDFPVDINNSEFQAVPSYRVRAGLTYRF